jgi:hypothetical protein
LREDLFVIWRCGDNVGGEGDNVGILGDEKIKMKTKKETLIRNKRRNKILPVVCLSFLPKQILCRIRLSPFHILQFLPHPLPSMREYTIA